ncbi:MAG: ATP-grasp domain-containing protein [Clostridiales bacterium]|nr:ATP-grasp domain-containing protein [Clostridiales bacterium]
MNRTKYYVVCDCREKFKSYLGNGILYNDHFKQANIDAIVKVINSLGYDCEYYGGVDKLIEAVNQNKKYDNCVFLNFNDGLTQQHKRGQTPILLEIITDKFSGSDAFASLLVSDKYCTNKLAHVLTDANVPRSILYFGNGKLPNEICEFNFPVIVKPNNEGSSIGIDAESLCHDMKSLLKQLEKLSQTFKTILIEEYISGFEFTVFLVGNENIVINQPLAIGVDSKFYLDKEICDAEIKALHRRVYVAPECLISSTQVEELKQISQMVFKHLGLRDYARLDFRYNNGKFYLLEANTVPAIGENSDVGEVCKLIGISFKDFIDILLKTVNARLKI